MQELDLQGEEFKILCQFKKYCVKHGLKYNLEGGTLLGAVRHKGFIPWDDDIDVIMPRQDYVRFLQLVEKESVGDNLVLVTRDSGLAFRSPYAKLCNSRTIVYEHGELQEAGVFIDIFPIDGAANNESIIKCQYIFTDVIKVLEGYARMDEVRRKALPLRKKIRAFICRSLGVDFWRTWLDHIFMRYEYGKTKYVSQIAWSTKLVYNLTEEYDRQVELEFEGEKFACPSCYDNRLRQMYGDYMQMPAEQDRHSKHSIVGFWKDK